MPGLGHRNPSFEKYILRSWGLWGADAEVFRMNWTDKEAWEPKFERLLKRIDELLAENKKVGLVADSAGTPVIINAYAARKNKLIGVVCICGKINRPETLGARYKEKNVALKPAVTHAVSSIAQLNDQEKSRILSRRAIYDELVKKPDSYVDGAKNQVVFGFGHFLTIVTQIIFGAPSFIRFLKRQAKASL